MTDTQSAAHAPGLAERLGMGLALAGMTARLLVPTESAAAGDTLWIVGLLFVAASTYCLGRWQQGYRVKLDAFAIALGLIIVGHLVSGFFVFWDGGHRRGAANVIWEWLSLGATCVVLRRNTAVVHLILAMMVVLAGHGIWQYFYDFPRLRAEYAASVSDSVSPIVAFQARQDLTAQGIPESDAARRLFADRLASLEPLGPFALANTLGGLLATALLLGAALLVGSRRGAARLILGIALMIPIGYCLVLTKSRTAAVGLIAGLLVLGLRQLIVRRRPESPEEEPTRQKSGWLPILVTTSLLAGVVISGVMSGGLDQEVISESPKSLQYRMQYWQGTIDTLRESPVLGTGPGNFRQHYNVHKLPESSEEILDPHNMFLDAWCSGGMVALLGLLMLLGVVSRQFFRADDGEPQHIPYRLTLIGGLSGFGLVLAQTWLTGQERPLLTLSLAGGFVAAWFAVRFALSDLSRRAVSGAGVVAALGLSVHLLGAGGFGMPAVMQVLLLLTAVAIPPVAERLYVRRWVGLAPALGSLCAVFVCVLTGIGPVYRAEFLLARGDTLSGYAALADYGLADRADRWDPEPIRRCGRTLFEEQNFSKALAAFSRARGRDPHAFADERALAIILRADWETRMWDTDLIEAAVIHMRRAVARYPTSPQLVAELALLQDVARQHLDNWQGPTAEETAARALKLQRINEEHGHVDRYLSPELLNQLNSLVERSDDRQGGSSSSEAEAE